MRQPAVAGPQCKLAGALFAGRGAGSAEHHSDGCQRPPHTHAHTATATATTKHTPPHPTSPRAPVLQGGIYTLPSHLSPGARDLIPRMLLVDPLKRITIPEIRCAVLNLRTAQTHC